AVSTGTISCTTAARQAASAGSAAYHSVYATPDASDPDAVARSTPCDVMWRDDPDTAANRTPATVARAKLPAVAASGSGRSGPTSEYTPQHTPATAMSARPIGSGAVTPGTVSTMRPPIASSTPIQSIRAGRSPRMSPAPIIVTCTAPNSTREPTLALM